MAKVKQLDVSAAIEHALDSNVSAILAQLDTAYHAVVTEVVRGKKVEGTLLYIPGIPYKLLKARV